MYYLLLVCTQSQSQEIQYLSLYGDKVHHSSQNTTMETSG